MGIQCHQEAPLDGAELSRLILYESRQVRLCVAFISPLVVCQSNYSSPH